MISRRGLRDFFSRRAFMMKSDNPGFIWKAFRAASDLLHHERFDHDRRESELHSYAKRAMSMTWHLEDSFEVRRIIENDWGRPYQGTPDLPITIDDVMTYMDQHKLELLPERACERLQDKLTSLRNGLSTHPESESYPLQLS